VATSTYGYNADSVLTSLSHDKGATNLGAERNAEQTQVMAQTMANDRRARAIQLRNMMTLLHNKEWVVIDGTGYEVVNGRIYVPGVIIKGRYYPPNQVVGGVIINGGGSGWDWTAAGGVQRPTEWGAKDQSPAQGWACVPLNEPWWDLDVYMDPRRKPPPLKREAPTKE